MNGQLFLALAVVVIGGALAAPSPYEVDEDPSQLAFFEDDKGETARLQGDGKIFSDFCLSSRDRVKVFMRSSLNVASAKLFKVLVNSVGEVTDDLVRAQEKAAEEGAELIKKSGIKEESDWTNAIEPEEKQVAAAPNENTPKGGGLWRTIGDVIRTMLDAVFATISSETAKRLALLKAQFNGENAREQIGLACSAIKFELKEDLSSYLESAKSELRASSEAGSLRDVIDAARLDTVGCITTRRVSMMARFCDVVLTLGPIFL